MTRTIRDEDDAANTVTIEDVKALHSSEKALLCVIDGEEMWIPHSQIHVDSEVFEKGGSGKLVITRWIAEQKELV